jgi:DDE superfamily endonuclease
MDSRAASCVASGLSRPRTTSGPDSRRVCREVRDARDGRRSHHSPCWHDGTERPLHRPADPEEQQDYDSGTKKGHTLKNLLVINETCHVGFLSHTSEGQASDKSLAELAGYTLPPGSCLYQDKGFQGCCLQEVTIVQPKKKPHGGELTPPEKATNRRSACIRIRIEHAIGGVKR